MKNFAGSLLINDLEEFFTIFKDLSKVLKDKDLSRILTFEDPREDL